jgi:hypothetical protein
MEADVLEIVSQVAGIGGSALGVFLLLFRDIIRKNIFPKLPPAEAYSLLRLITVAVWSVAIVGIAAWVYTTTQARPPSHEGTVTQHTEGTNSPAQNGNGNSIIINNNPALPVLPKNDPAATALLSCAMETLPRTFAPNEVVHFLNLYPLPITVVPVVDQVGGVVFDHSLAWAFNHSGKEWQWGELGTTAYKCEIVNYSDTPVIEVELALDLSFYDAIPAQNQPTAIAIGPLVLKRPWLIKVQKIDTGPSNRFFFYIYNGTENKVVKVLLPKTAQLRHLGEEKRQLVALDVPQLGGGAFAEYRRFPNIG